MSNNLHQDQARHDLGSICLQRLSADDKSPLAKKELTLFLLNSDLSFFENTVNPDQLDSDEFISPGSTLFSTVLVNTYFLLEVAFCQDTN